MRTVMTDLPAMAAWLQLHDSALPAGRMVHSSGFEEWLATRMDAGTGDIEHAVLDYLNHGYGALDAPLTAAAWRAAPCKDALIELDELLSSYKLSSNARQASVSAGIQLATTVNSIGLSGCDAYIAAVIAGTAPGNLAVVEGATQAYFGIDEHTAVLGSARSTLAAVLSVAVRLGRLGPLTAQRIQTRHIGTVVALVRRACDLPMSELSSSAMQFDIAGMRHEVRAQRLFAS